MGSLFGDQLATLNMLRHVLGSVAALQARSVSNADFGSVVAVHSEAGVELFGVVTFNGEDILGYVDQTASQINSVSGLQGDVDQRLAGTAGTGKVFQRVEALDVAGLH